MESNRTTDPNISSDRKAQPSGVASFSTDQPVREAVPFRILCVDDDTVGLHLRGVILERHGFAVALDSSPVQALHRDLLAFDLAILDYDMPGLNGVELLLAMRKLHVAYPIILLSGDLGAIDILQQRLFDRCLEKGLSLEPLLNVVSSYVQACRFPDLADDACTKVRSRILR